jgi:hypothetical protein
MNQAEEASGVRSPQSRAEQSLQVVGILFERAAKTGEGGGKHVAGRRQGAVSGQTQGEVEKRSPRAQFAPSDDAGLTESALIPEPQDAARPPLIEDEEIVGTEAGPASTGGEVGGVQHRGEIATRQAGIAEGNHFGEIAGRSDARLGGEVAGEEQRRVERSGWTINRQAGAATEEHGLSRGVVGEDDGAVEVAGGCFLQLGEVAPAASESEAAAVFGQEAERAEVAELGRASIEPGRSDGALAATEEPGVIFGD